MDHSKQQNSLEDELSNVIETLHGLFDEIGLARNDREGREASVYAALNAALHDQLRMVSQEKNQLVEECHKVITQMKQMEKSLADNESGDRTYRVTAPLLQCRQDLMEKYKLVKRRHAERYDSVKQLVKALDTYASRLEPSFIQIPLPPITNDSSAIASFDLSHSYYERLEQEFNRVYEEYTKRLATVQTVAKEIINLYAELGVPTAQIDRSILENGATEPEKLGLARDDMDRLKAKRQKLVDEREKRKARVDELKKEIGELWMKLGMEEGEKKMFLAQHRGCDLKCIRELEYEHERLLELKRENLHVFVEDCRQTLAELWEQLYFSEEEIAQFHPATSDVYTDALLQTHEMEIERLKDLFDERAPILNLINKHRDLINDKEQLAISANDPSRLLGRGGGRDPTRLLREEKMRKRITKELPKIEVELKKSLEQWEDDYGYPLTVNGENYLETLIRLSPVAQSRASTKTPAPAAPNPMRGRSNTIGASTTRQRSRPAPVEKAPMRSKTPTARSKTPTARPRTPNQGQLYNPHANTSSTVGRTQGRALTSAASSYSTASSGYSTVSRSTTSTIDRTGARTPGLGGRIPQPLGSKTPTRIARPPLTAYPSGVNTSPERREPPPSYASIKRKAGQDGLGSAPKMQQLLPQTENRLTNLHPSVQRQMDDERFESRSLRSVSPAESANYQVYPSDDEEEDSHDTPKAASRPHPGSHLEYESSKRQMSTSTISTVGGNSGSENWETYGEESDMDSEMDPREAYYQRKAQQTGYTGYGSARTVRPSQSNSDEWMSEAGCF